MKRTIELTLVLLVLMSSVSAYAQVIDSVYYQRLFYTCKAWGHVKYYHTEPAKGAVDWDDELISALPELKDAPDNEAFNQSLLTMLTNAGEMGMVNGSIPTIPDSLNNNTDITWIENPIFSNEVRENLNIIKFRFRPQTNVYVGEQWPGGAPSFNTDAAYASGEDFPSEEKRILALFRYWNIINYFFPYKDIMDIEWDVTLREFIPAIVKADNAIDYHLAFRELTTRINDSHAFFSSPTYTSIFGNKYPPFQTRYIENEMVITKLLPSVTEVRVGDVIREIDGIEINELRDSLRKYAYGSNDIIIERELNSLIERGDFGDFTMTVDRGGDIRTVTLSRNSFNFNNLNIDDSPVWRDTTINDSCKFGIVDMGRLEPSDLNLMFRELSDTDAIIFDIRNYPNGTLWPLIDYLFTSPVFIANFTTPDITYPGRLSFGPETIGNGISNPYRGEVIILFDERTQSQAEYTVMGLEQFPGAIKIGSTTAAADGNVALMFLPGNILTYATFLGVFYPDYTPTQRVGIIPDYEVHPTILGIRSGRDEVLDFALSCDFVAEEIEVGRTEIKLCPNPTGGIINYELVDDTAISIELFDIIGRKVRSFQVDGKVGEIDMFDLESGRYYLRVNGEESSTSMLVIKI